MEYLKTMPDQQKDTQTVRESKEQSIITEAEKILQEFRHIDGSLGKFIRVESLNQEDKKPPISEAEYCFQETEGIQGIGNIRLQLDGENLNFAKAAEIVPMLRRMGFSTVYLSPILDAADTHGYTVTDPNKLNPQLGTEEEFDRLCAVLKEQGMNLMLDIVPNHMAARAERNQQWADILRNGPNSVFWDHFDMRPDRDKKFMIPRLGASLKELWYWGWRDGQSADKFKLAYKDLDENSSEIRLLYHENEYPINVESYVTIFEGYEDECVPLQELIELSRSLANKSGEDYVNTANKAQSLLKDAFRDEAALEFIMTRIDSYNKIEGDEQENEKRYERFSGLMAQQHYKLGYWKDSEPGYRNFFGYTDYVTIRQENPQAFYASHKKFLELMQKHPDVIAGLRIDHIDGLYNAKDYLDLLKKTASEARGGKPIYIAVEKILGESELLPSDWPVYGEVGYLWKTYSSNLTINASGESEITDIYRDFILDSKAGFVGEMSLDDRAKVLTTELSAHINYMVSHLKYLADSDNSGSMLGEEELKHALVYFTAGLDVYRTYVNSAEIITQEDAQRVATSLAKIKGKVNIDAYNFLKKVVFLDVNDSLKEQCLSFIQRLQQLTGPAKAKVTEDTEFFRRGALLSVAEVGYFPVKGDPISEFHTHNEEMRKKWRLTMNAGSSHDTKRSVDLQLAMNSLSEKPELWKEVVNEMDKLAQGKSYISTTELGTDLPDLADRYAFYQTIAGLVPLTEKNGLREVDITDEFVQRMQDYMLKYVREAKKHTNHNDPVKAYEDAMSNFVKGTLTDQDFRQSVLRIREFTNHFGSLNTMSELSLRMTTPGIPDVYCRDLIHDDSLVDPDNRRPVDFAQIQANLENLEQQIWDLGYDKSAQALARDIASDQMRLFMLAHLLHLRRRKQSLLQEGEYVSLVAKGEHQNNVVSFARTDGQDTVVTIAPCLNSQLVEQGELPVGDVWKDTVIPLANGRYRNIFTGEIVDITDGELKISRILQTFPTAVLEKIIPNVA